MTRSARIRVAISIAAIVLVVVIYVAGARHWLSVESLRTHRDALLQFTSAHYLEALGVAALGCLVLVAISLPVSGIFMLLCGMLFGRWVGVVIVDISATLGATLAMLMVRYLVQDFVRERLRGHRHAKELLKGFERHRGSYLLFLRVAPAFPFWLTNILFGLTDVPAWKFLLLTLLGLIPDCLIYCNIGTNLATMQSKKDLLSPGSILALALLAILCLLPVAIQQLKQRGMLQSGWPFERGS